MVQKYEWRTRGEVYDAILAIEGDTVQKALEVSPTTLKSYLNDLISADVWHEAPFVEGDKSDPEMWGELVMARANSGEILDMDPELFWDGMYLWFRSRGVDPNMMIKPGQIIPQRK
jgi:hypothetical protein